MTKLDANVIYWVRMSLICKQIMSSLVGYLLKWAVVYWFGASALDPIATTNGIRRP